MLNRLLDYVNGLPVEEVPKLLLQDVALCQLWMDSLPEGDPNHEAYAGVRGKIAEWKSAEAPAEDVTAGRRHQMLLRDGISALKADRHQEISLAEAAFLCAAVSLARDVKPRSRFERVLSMVEPEVDILQIRLNKDVLTPEVPDLNRLIQYATEKDIERAPARDTRLLAGIDLPCRGPVVSFPCHLRMLGDVPDRCTVVVEGEGHCSVDGYVIGRVLAKQACDVRGNISGVCVVLYGDIRGRSIINNAHVVAKMGNVHCRSAQGPKLVFAGGTISIVDGTMLGTFIARNMEVGQDVRGGEIQVSDMVRASYFRHLGATTLAIVLRRELSCHDFGEVTGPEMNKLLSAAYRLRGEAHHYETIADLAQREAERSAQSVLMYLLGGTDAHRKLGSLMSMHRRMELMSRVESNLRAVLETAQDSLVKNEEQAAHTVQNFDPNLAIFQDGEQVDEDLAKEHEDIVKLRDRLRAKGLDRKQKSIILQQTVERLEKLEADRAKLKEEIEKKEKSIQSLEPYEKLVQSSGQASTKLQVLQRLLPNLKKQGMDSPIASRLRSGYATMELRKTGQRVRYVDEYKRRAANTLRDFRAVSDRLGKDFQVEVLERPEDESLGARAMGRFEQGVEIFLEVMMEDQADQPEGTVIRTQEDDGMKTFIRGREGVTFHMKRESGR